MLLFVLKTLTISEDESLDEPLHMWLNHRRMHGPDGDDKRYAPFPSTLPVWSHQQFWKSTSLSVYKSCVGHAYASVRAIDYLATDTFPANAIVNKAAPTVEGRTIDPQ